MFVLSIKKACGAKILESQIIGQLQACDQNLWAQQDEWFIFEREKKRSPIPKIKGNLTEVDVYLVFWIRHCNRIVLMR